MSQAEKEIMEQTKALMRRLEAMRPLYVRPDNISPRTPNGASKFSNTADRIERQLRTDGHKIWGFVVYRCTYTSDASWETFMQRLHASIHEYMDFYNGLDLLTEDCFKLTVLSDANRFDRASTNDIRKHFTSWCEEMLHLEQGSQAEIRQRRPEQFNIECYKSQRYEYCLQVDEESLQSVLSNGDRGWVNMIKRDWPMDLPEDIRRQIQEYEDEVDEDEKEIFPAIEGCTENDVGWMRVRLESAIPAFYAHLDDENYWNVMYLRPPRVTPLGP